MTLSMPVSSSRLTKIVPLAVAGRWRWVTTPPTLTLRPDGTLFRAATLTAPAASSRARAYWTTWLSGDTPVAHRSAAVISGADMTGSWGASVPQTTPWSLGAAVWAPAPPPAGAGAGSGWGGPTAPAVDRASMA